MARRVKDAGLKATFSYAGRVANPKAQPLPTREGGFGGVDGLIAYLKTHEVSHVIDATHPFAAQMSWNAFEACRAAHVPLAALSRPAWQAQPGDRWTRVADIEGAVDALAGPAKRVMLALGRLHMNDFARQPHHHYVLRLVDRPDEPPALPNHTVVVARGPFDVSADTALFQDHGIEIIVCKNAGGAGAVAKLEAARALDLPVIMIDRPQLPPRMECATPEAVLEWLATHP